MSLTVYLHDRAGNGIGRHAIRDGRAFPEAVFLPPTEDTGYRFFRRVGLQGVGRHADEYHEITAVEAKPIPGG